MEEKQNSDGSISGIRERDAFEIYRTGGSMSPANTPQTPAYMGGINLSFNVAGGTDTAGGLLQWQNNLGYDIVVTAHYLDITTASTSTTCTVSFGAASGSTTSASNMINGQNVTVTGVYNGGALSVKVANGSWLTGSKATGATAGLVARATFMAIQSNPTAGGI
jgi:hypothetical protein